MIESALKANILSRFDLHHTQPLSHYALLRCGQTGNREPNLSFQSVAESLMWRALAQPSSQWGKHIHQERMVCMHSLHDAGSVVYNDDGVDDSDDNDGDTMRRWQRF